MSANSKNSPAYPQGKLLTALRHTLMTVDNDTVDNDPVVELLLASDFASSIFLSIFFALGDNAQIE
ncbi:hypothetical protein N7G274_009551 [Stereocaulon virgatum]|uniref:Uncharacterized protein n=1 Tax=Stereocaulon virgatum TaxID=373712 RepID=A0ABR3ZXX6_9LECA